MPACLISGVRITFDLNVCFFAIGERQVRGGERRTVGRWHDEAGGIPGQAASGVEPG